MRKNEKHNQDSSSASGISLRGIASADLRGVMGSLEISELLFLIAALTLEGLAVFCPATTPDWQRIGLFSAGGAIFAILLFNRTRHKQTEPVDFRIGDAAISGLPRELAPKALRLLREQISGREPLPAPIGKVTGSPHDAAALVPYTESERQEKLAEFEKERSVSAERAVAKAQDEYAALVGPVQPSGEVPGLVQGPSGTSSSLRPQSET